MSSTQRALDFNPVPASVEGEPYCAARLWLLGRLQERPVSTLELRREPWPASMNPAARILELRNHQHDIRTVRRDRTTWYVLYVKGLAQGGEP
jgi:hypothetical protein